MDCIYMKINYCYECKLLNTYECPMAFQKQRIHRI